MKSKKLSKVSIGDFTKASDFNKLRKGEITVELWAENISDGQVYEVDFALNKEEKKLYRQLIKSIKSRAEQVEYWAVPSDYVTRL